MRKNYKDEASNRVERPNRDGANYRDGSRYGDRKKVKFTNAQKRYDSDRMHAFTSAIEMLEFSQDERSNPNKDIFPSFQIIGVVLIFIMFGTLPPLSTASASAPYSMIGLILGLIGSSAIIGCLFILDDTILHADLRPLTVSAICLMIVQYGLLFEYLLDSPAAEYLLILLRTIVFPVFFGSLTSCFARNAFLFPSIAVRLCTQTPAFMTCYASIIQSVSICMHFGGLNPYLGSELINTLSGILGSITGIIMIGVFTRVPHWVDRALRPFHTIVRFFFTLIHKKQAGANRGGRDE